VGGEVSERKLALAQELANKKRLLRRFLPNERKWGFDNRVRPKEFLFPSLEKKRESPARKGEGNSSTPPKRASGWPALSCQSIYTIKSIWAMNARSLTKRNAKEESLTSQSNLEIRN